MNPDLPPKERLQHQHLSLSCDIDLLQAVYYHQHFSRHTHDGYAFGIITSGQLDFSYQHKNWHARPGDINLVVPGEAHDGHPKDNHGWSYHMLYLPTTLLREAYIQRTGHDSLPWFLPGCIEQSPLAPQLAALYQQLTNPALERLQKESLLLDWLITFIKQYSDQPLPSLRLGQEPLAISRAADYLHNHYDAAVSLRTLADISGLSAYHLLRTFEKFLGLPPHLYQQQLRIEAARSLLAAGHPPAEVALTVGFSDQSHFTHQFKKITGLTPACYQRAMT